MFVSLPHRHTNTHKHTQTQTDTCTNAHTNTCVRVSKDMTSGRCQSSLLFWFKGRKYHQSPLICYRGLEKLIAGWLKAEGVAFSGLVWWWRCVCGGGRGGGCVR